MTVVILSNHAKLRLSQRQVSDELVSQCIAHPDRIYAPTNKWGEEKEYAMRLNGMVLVLVLKEVDNEIFFVITAFQSSKIKKYLG